LFPWVVSDFGLLDAIESGIVKVPRFPVLDGSIQGDLPKFRDVYRQVMKANQRALPRKGRGKQSKASMNPADLPHLLLSALDALYKQYEIKSRSWEGRPDIGRPPVFIIVCNNTATSKLVADYGGATS
jgi:type III restriction enzyme